jgi:hypothetical protein
MAATAHVSAGNALNAWCESMFALDSSSLHARVCAIAAHRAENHPGGSGAWL